VGNINASGNLVAGGAIAGVDGSFSGLVQADGDLGINIGSVNISDPSSGGVLTIDQSVKAAGNISPSANNSFDVGSSSLRWRDLFLARLLNISRNQTNSTLNNTDMHLLIDNPSSTGQSMLVFQVNGSVKGGVRGDYAGNFNWHASGTQGHQFYSSLDTSGAICGFSSSGVQIKRGAGAVSQALLHIAAGGASANSAPIKLTSGSFLTTTEAGAVEYNGRFAFTESDAIRRYPIQAQSSSKTSGTPVTDGYISVQNNGTTIKLMTTA
jgi:hypothetical protein